MAWSYNKLACTWINRKRKTRETLRSVLSSVQKLHYVIFEDKKKMSQIVFN
jgi:hypothetical protein